MDSARLPEFSCRVYENDSVCIHCGKVILLNSIKEEPTCDTVGDSRIFVDYQKVTTTTSGSWVLVRRPNRSDVKIAFCECTGHQCNVNYDCNGEPYFSRSFDFNEGDGLVDYTCEVFDKQTEVLETFSILKINPVTERKLCNAISISIGEQ